MLVGKSNRLLLFFCMTTFATITRFCPSRLSIFETSSFCSALSLRARNKGISNKIRSLDSLSVPFSSSGKERLFSSSYSSTSMSLSASEQPHTQRKGVQLNHAGASPSPQRVLDRVYAHLKLEQDNGGYAAQNAVQDSGELDKVYSDVAKLIHATTEVTKPNEPSFSTANAHEIALVESATVGWTRAFYAMVQRDEQERKSKFEEDKCPSSTKRVILISEAEYAANVVAACQWAKDHSDHWMVLAIPSSTSENGSTGMVDLNVFDSMLEGKFRYKNNSGEDEYLDPSSIALVCITHVPTNSGIVNPVEEIGERISTYNRKQQQQETAKTYLNSIKFLVDACQSVGQMDVNVKKIKCDALVATGRKYLRGPRGTGFLYISNDILSQDIVPSHIDHYGCPVAEVPAQSLYQLGTQLHNNGVINFAPREGAKRFEFWESSISSRLGLGEAVCVAMERGLNEISRDIEHLSSFLRDELEKRVPGVQIHHRDTTTCGIVTFSFENVDSRSIQSVMWKEGFELSMVPATSTPLDSSSTNVPDLVRASISYTTTERDILDFCSSLALGFKTNQFES